MPKLFTRSFAAVFAANILTANCFYILIASLPIYVTEALKLGQTNVGLLMGAFAITSVLIRPFSGFLLDNAGRLKVYLPALVMFALCAFGYAFTASFAALLTLRMLHGVAWGLSGTAGATIAADIVPKERRAEGLGYYSMAMSVGMALGPAVGVLLLGLFPYETVFLCCGALATLAVVAGFQVRPPAVPLQKGAFSPTALIEKRVLSIAFMQLFFGISYGSIMSFAIVYGKQMGMGGTGYFFMIFAVFMALMRPISGKYLDKNGPGHIMGLGLIATMGGFALIAAAKGIVAYLAAAIVLGVGTGIVLPLFMAMAVNVVAPQRRGAANATVFTAFDLGIGAGSMFLGVVADLASMSAMYLFACGILIIPLVYYYISGRKRYELMESEIKKAGR